MAQAKGSLKRMLLTVLIAAGSLCALAGIGLLVIGYALDRSVADKTDPRAYAGVVKARAEKSERYAFLPAAIPAEAVKTAFYHIPGFLQGGDVVALRLELPGPAAAENLARLESSGLAEIGSLEGLPAPRAYPAYGKPKGAQRGASATDTGLPGDFRIFLQGSGIADIKERWNHNILAFTAVSLRRNEVVHYIHSW